jgi:hypothetical protein
VANDVAQDPKALVAHGRSCRGAGTGNAMALAVGIAGDGSAMSNNA